MSIKLEQGLVTILSGITTARPHLKQPTTFPAIHYQRIYTTRTNSIDGANVGVTEVGMQVDCMSDSYDGCKELADLVRGVLHGYSGVWGEITSPETHLTAQFVNLQTENDLSDIDGDDQTFWVSQRYQIWTNMD
jgi:hypothetical protein